MSLKADKSSTTSSVVPLKDTEWTGHFACISTSQIYQLRTPLGPHQCFYGCLLCRTEMFIKKGNDWECYLVESD